MLLGPLLLAGCATYKPISGNSVAASAEVRLGFDPPITVAIERPEFSPLTVANVEELEGKVLERTADEIVLEVSRARTVDRYGPRRFARNSIARVPLQRVELRQGSSGRTVGLILGLAVVALVIGVAAAGSSEPTPPPTKNEPVK
jgi:hypothetical protein